ncbi:muts domain V-domain-containing protein [Phakopsora pachyrhizi]|uniref:DNA mismatch repair protein MSH3 n=1 Tax=Phakopsora pachyrhizi TaxID=170000 RepID=A0AAV0BL93_PHAPC|nr:muts domain V-domain-containing protein [Phakopsora pachyrhizi]CAH7688090.1 muts domain V-domain-containing protein [Phakopsora pachyrhizi]
MSEGVVSYSNPQQRASVTDHDHEGQLGYWTVALTESRGVGREVGVVGINIESAKVVVSQLADSQTYEKTIHWLRQRTPSTLLLVAPATSSTPSILHNLLAHTFAEVTLIVLPRSAFSSEKGLSLLEDLASPGPQKLSTMNELRQKYYALGAASAVIDWIQLEFSRNGHFGWGKNCLNVEWISVEGTVLIDLNTVIDLELITNAINTKSKHSLFGLLNQTYTAMASRLLRNNLLAPSTEIEVIEERLDAVQELLSLEEGFFTIRKALKPLAQIDLDKLVGSIATAKIEQRTETMTQDPAVSITKKLETLRALRAVLKTLGALVESLSDCSSELLRRASSFLKDGALEEVASTIKYLVNEDSLLGVQKGGISKQNVHAYAIKPGEGNQLLNVARETYKENLNDAIQICEELQVKYNLPKLQFKFETRGGFILFIKKENLRATSSDSGYSKLGLPSIFTNVVKRGKVLQFTCLDLKKKNQLIYNSYQEICLLSVLGQIFEEVKQRISSFYRLSETIALLDMLASFANVSFSQRYVRPEFTDTLAISQGRHPIKERFDPNFSEFIPNDTYATRSFSFQLITGPNMSGKSIFLRQIALMAIMAQIGSFCPADYVSFPIFDAVLTYLSKNDDIEASLSSFSSEMKTMSGILSALGVCKNALIIIDELGRGTSPIEGVGLAYAFCEEIISAKTFCFFATHFTELTKILSVYPNAVCLHLETRVDEKSPSADIQFFHKVKESGGYNIFLLASVAALPPDMIKNAKNLHAKTAELSHALEKKSNSSKVMTRRKVIMDVESNLYKIAYYRQLLTSCFFIGLYYFKELEKT